MSRYMHTVRYRGVTQTAATSPAYRRTTSPARPTLVPNGRLQESNQGFTLDFATWHARLSSAKQAA